MEELEHEGQLDELDQFIAEESADPVFLAALEDAETRSGLLRRLVNIRQALDIRQGEIAAFMGNSQSTVSELENGTADFLVSTIQKYARAVDARLYFEIEMPADCAWTRPVRRDVFVEVDQEEVADVVDIRQPTNSDRTWIDEANRRESAVELSG